MNQNFDPTRRNLLGAVAASTLMTANTANAQTPLEKRTMPSLPAFESQSTLKGSTFECWKVIRNKSGFAFNRFDQDQLDIKAMPLTKDYTFD